MLKYCITMLTKNMLMLACTHVSVLYTVLLSYMKIVFGFHIMLPHKFTWYHVTIAHAIN